MSTDKPTQSITIISDGTGETAIKVVDACLAQFEGVAVDVQVHPQVNDLESLRRSFDGAAANGSMVVTTLVQAEQRAEAERLAQKHRLPYLDVLGALLGNLSDFLRAPPVGTPGLMHTTGQSYFRRIAAVEYTVKADDGKVPAMLPQADIVLVGVSRTSKTPLSIYLAHKGYKVANVPLVLGRDPNDSLWEVDPRRIFALTIDPDALRDIRERRVEHMKMRGRPNYCQMDYVEAELDFGEDLFRRNREWPVIDVTRKAVEETAAIILRVLADRGLTYPHREVGQLWSP